MQNQDIILSSNNTSSDNKITINGWAEIPCKAIVINYSEGINENHKRIHSVFITKNNQTSISRET